jgi:hypothetical protein
MPVKNSTHSRPFAALAAMVFGLCVVLAPTVARGEDDGADVTLAMPEVDASGPIPVPPPTPALGPDGTPLPMEGVPSDAALARASAPQARNLAETRVEEAFPAIAEDPLRSFETDDVTKFLNDHVARVNPPGPGGPALVASVAPLRDSNEGGSRQAIDFDVEREGGHFEAVNPLVDVSFPENLGNPLQLQRLGLGISVSSPEASQSAGQRLSDGKVFYHEATKDTDLVLVPVTAGAQLLAQIRSENAPEELLFNVTLPDGTQLQEAGNEGIEVVRDGDRVAVLTSPIAFDADGLPVESLLELRADNTIALITRHRTGHAYPVLIDPEIGTPITENWLSSSWQGGNSSSVGWAQGSWIPGAYSAPITVPTTGNPQNACGSAFNCWQGGLYAQAGANWQLLAGAVGQWIYQPPGNSSYITSATLSPINYSRNGENGWFTPHAYFGVFSTRTGLWPSVGTKGDNSIPNPTSFSWTGPPDGPTPDDPNEVVFGMGTSTNRIGAAKLTANRTAALGGAMIGVGDGEAPRVDSVTHSPALPTNWTQAYSGAATITGWDGTPQSFGLGTYSIGFKSAAPGSAWDYQNATTTVTLPNPPDYKGPTQTQTVPCSGTRVTPCPTSLAKTFNYDSSQFPEGINTVQVKATDILGKSGTSTWEIKVDRTAPTIELPGDQGEKPGITVSDPTYMLRVRARDGDAGEPETPNPTTAESGVASVKLYLDGGTTPVAERNQSCSAPLGSCQGKVSWRINRSDIAQSPHTVRVLATDQVGNQAERVVPINASTAAGDVFHVSEYTGDPDGTGELIAETWFDPGTIDTRRVDPNGTVTTRALAPCDPDQPAGPACDHLRLRAPSNYSSAPNDTYTAYMSERLNDPNLPSVSTLRTVLDPSITAELDPVEIGPLSTVLEAWQAPPPGSASTFELFEIGPTDGRALLWVDSATGLPLKVVGTPENAPPEPPHYWDYDPERYALSELSDSFFLVDPPTEASEVELMEARPDDTTPSVTDEETQTTFRSFSLGDNPSVDGGPEFCLVETGVITNAVHPALMQNDEADEGGVESTVDLDDEHERDSAPESNPNAPETKAFASYDEIEEGGQCEPGEGIAQTPDLMVTSMASNSSAGVGWEDAYATSADAIVVEPIGDPAEGLGGQAIALSATDATSAIADAGATAVIVDGPYELDELQDLAEQLEAE